MRDREEWMRRLGPLYPGAVALRQTTLIRWPVGLVAAGDDLSRSAPWMVAVGAAVGFCAWIAVWILAYAGTVPAVGAVAGYAVSAALGAGLVEAGLARYCEHARAGTGTVAVVSLALLRLVTLLATSTSVWLGVLLVAPALGRWAALLLQRLGDPIDSTRDSAPHGARDLVVGEVAWSVVGAGAIAVAIAAMIAIGWAGLVAVLIAGGAAFGLGLDAQRRLGGLGPEVLATAAAVGEVVLLLCAAAAHSAQLSPFVSASVP